MGNALGALPRYSPFSGSSPRAWGTHDPTLGEYDIERFIPTCVGNAQRHSHEVAAACGSSPRAWGKRLLHHLPSLLQRFIPTCVGNARPKGAKIDRVLVHPHVRGERKAVLSSRQRYYRFIPTCVGNASGTCEPINATGGSSPRAWGTRKKPSFGWLVIRFIPTCVGNAKKYRRFDEPSRFIPTCVGNAKAVRASKPHYHGSSPRAWGTRSERPQPNGPSSVHPHVRGERFRWCRAMRRGCRFIPTCVGNAAHLRQVSLCLSVHPHVRGERDARMRT